MKNVILLLITITFTLHINAQIDVQQTKDFINFYPKDPQSAITIDFLLINNIKMTIEMDKYDQLDSIKNIESTLQTVWANLLPIKERFSKPFVSTRINYNFSTEHPTFRIVEHSSNVTSFKYTNGEFNQIKADRDTSVSYTHLTLPTKRIV